MKKIFITGAAGFIGSHLWDYLEKQNNKVIGIDNLSHPCRHPKNNRVVYGDVRYYKDIEPFVKEADKVIHLAAQIHVDKSITNPQETVDININGTLNVLEAVRKYNKEMIFASSSEVYGTQQEDKFIGTSKEDDYAVLTKMHFQHPTMGECHPLDAQSPYAASKVAGDRLCFSYWKTYGTKVSILRNFNTFGEYQNDGSYGGVIAIFTRQALAGEPITVYGNGNQERDYMHVKDAVQGYKFCLDNKLWGQPVNIGTGKTVRIIDLAHKIKEITNSNSEIIHLKERPGEVQRLCADTSYAESKGFKSITNFDKHLKQYVRWYKKTYRKTV